MAYFLPSFFQKRLLRYALSRLELVDTEALDLDSLGIRWGQRSTVELRDIGLRLEKLATLLHLPPSSELLSARIRFLKLTVPADIYSSGIICEASGIDVHLRLPSEETYRASKDGKPTGQETYVAAAYDPGNDQILPTPTDLAESFLESEPKEEKEELQAAISSRSQVLHSGSILLSDDEEELGLGNEGVSLPSFVAAFLKGVAERLQVKIYNISIRVDMEMKQEGTWKRQPEDKPDLITGLLSVSEVSVGAVGASSGSDEAFSRKGKRLVSLSDINLALVSDPAVFSNYARLAPPISPTTPMQPKSSQPPSRIPSPRIPSPPPFDESDSDSDSVLAMTRSTILEPPQDLVIHRRDETDLREMEESVYTYDGRFSDADTEENRSDGYLEDSQLLDDDRLLDNPAYLDSVLDLQFQDDDVEGPDNESVQNAQFPPNNEDIPPPQSHEFRTTGTTSPYHDTEGAMVHASDEQELDLHASLWSSQRYLEAGPSASPEAAHEASPEEESDLGKDSDIPASSHSFTPPSDTHSSDSPEPSNDDELSESKLFSNEEAQSMYMSAISQGSEYKSFIPNIPGAWDSPEPTVVPDADVQEQLIPPVDVSRGEQDETSMSTPKITAQEGSHLSEKQIFDDFQNKTEPEVTDKESTQSSPTLNKFTDVAKRFFNIGQVLIWIPSVDQDGNSAETSPGLGEGTSSDGLKEPTAHLRGSVVEDDLLASTIYASSRLRSDSIDSSHPSETTEPRSPRPQENVKDYSFAPNDERNEIAVEISSVEIQFDNAIGWLITKAGQRILQAFGGDGSDVPKQNHPPKDGQGQQAFSLTLNKFFIKYVENIPGQACAFEDSQLHSPSFFGLSHEEILLQMTASGLKAHFSADNDKTKFRLYVTKFSLGFASDDLVSFSEALKMRESTRDVLSPLHGDISLTLTKSSDSASLTVTTLPLQLNLNIQRLEEVVGWVGGLSTILELGSSISSVSTVKGTNKPSPKRHRGVHFESSPPPADTRHSGSVPWKVNARVGGIVLDVVGESHYLKLRTTAVKVVNRFEGIGVQIDKAKLSGPIPLDETKDAPAKINLNNIRIEYLHTPKEPDLDRLLALITPSKDKYDEDDDIMLDTLFRQRKQGSVLRATIAGAKIVVSRINDLDSLSQLGDELSRLSNVAKYLPEDDRPGILTLTLIRELEAQIHLGEKVGNITAHFRNAEAAYISLPSLIAAQLGRMTVVRNENEELLGEALPLSMEQNPTQNQLPLLMVRYIADEMDPTVKIKLHNLRAEYTIPSMIAFLGIGEDMTSGDVATNMVNSLANLAETQHSHPDGSQSSVKSESPKAPTKPAKLAIVLSDCVLGLNPRGTAAKGLVVLTNAKFSAAIHNEDSSEAMLDLKKASIMIIDDVQNVGYADNIRRGGSAVPQNNQIQSFIDMGFVPVSSISSATAMVKLMRLAEDGTKSLDVELKDDLLILETCADSTQTLISILNGLQPPTPPSVTMKYRTEVLPLQDMLASFSGDAFATDPAIESEVVPGAPADAEIDDTKGQIEDELEYVSDFYPVKSGPENESFNDGMATPGSNDLLSSFHSQYYVSSSVADLEFHDNHFSMQSAVGGTAHRWDSTQNTYGLSDDSKLLKSPVRIRVRDAHVIWNLFDGYDWQRTRDAISKAVKDVEKKATERRARAGNRMSPGFEEEEESVIGDCLFNSIYIGIPANKDPREIRNDINHNIDDLVSETGSYATTTTVTGAAARQGQSPSIRGRKLRLSRSKYHKMTFELKGICADVVVFPPESGETQSSLDVRINDLEIFDHVPTSTWKKFATYMHEAGEKESGMSMVHLEILTVRPVPELAASEIVLKATLLPLRLHVDQDALDFICRFFEFRDDSAPAPSAPEDVPFLQRVEINAVPVKLDFKPKRVDYAGLRSGRTTEFMNFFVLDGADMVMRHVIIYGVSGFDKLGQTLNDIWMPDIRSNQLPGVLAGLAPIRSLVNVGGGVKDLVVIPMREYRKDGRIVRSIQKGALAFAKTTSNELVKLGAKLALGTQTVLQGAEELLTSPSAQLVGTEEDLTDEDEAKKISLYADQPVGVVQGLRGGFRGLERDLLLARDAIVAVPGEVVESGSAKAAARAVWKRAPTVILRPAIGVSKAVGQTLLGAGNALDPSNRRKMEDKYKHH